MPKCPICGTLGLATVKRWPENEAGVERAIRGKAKNRKLSLGRSQGLFQESGDYDTCFRANCLECYRVSVTPGSITIDVLAAAIELPLGFRRATLSQEAA